MKNLTITSLVISLFVASCQDGAQNGKDSAVITQTTTNPHTSNSKISVASLRGAWTEANPINQKEVQGFKLNEDGAAESINMATLLYRQWWLRDSSLYLVAESKGNKQSVIDTMVYHVVNVTNNELILTDRNRTISYKKQ